MNVPDLFGVLCDGAVAGEFAGIGDIEDDFGHPAFGVGEGLGGFFLGAGVALEVGADEITIDAGEVIHEGVIAFGFIGREEARADELDGALEGFILLDEGGGIIALVAGFLNFLGVESEEEEVFRADFFADLDICAVEGSDGKRAVHLELHITRAGGFFASGGDLFGEVGGGDHAFGEGYAVIGDEEEFEQVAGLGILVEGGGDVVDKADV